MRRKGAAKKNLRCGCRSEFEIARHFAISHLNKRHLARPSRAVQLSSRAVRSNRRAGLSTARCSVTVTRHKRAIRLRNLILQLTLAVALSKSKAHDLLTPRRVRLGYTW